MLRILTLIICGLGLTFSFAKTELKVKKQRTLIFTDSNAKSIVGTLKYGENIYLLERGEVRSKITTRLGLTGWVKNSSTEFAEIETGRDYISEQNGISFLENSCISNT